MTLEVLNILSIVALGHDQGLGLAAVNKRSFRSGDPEETFGDQILPVQCLCSVSDIEILIDKPPL